MRRCANHQFLFLLSRKTPCSPFLAGVQPCIDLLPIRIQQPTGVAAGPHPRGLGYTAVELRRKSLSGRQSLARALTRNPTLPKELKITSKSKSKSKRQATVLNSTAVRTGRGLADYKSYACLAGRRCRAAHLFTTTSPARFWSGARERQHRFARRRK